MRSTSLVLSLTLALLTVACSTAPAPAPDTRAADVQAVKEVEAAWVNDAASKDAEKWASYFTDDGSGLYPGAATLNGKAAIRVAMAPYFADPNFALTFQSTRTVASKGGDLVYSQGTYSMTMTDPKTKKPMTDKGKFLTVYAKQADGSWKAVADTFNSDSPM
ncbi:MAG TPA: SgcJ/EcaC family oxidoreductase [Terriglobales bacterium]